MNCSWIDYLRQPKIFGMAIFDWAATLLGVYILAKFIHPYFENYRFVNFYIMMVGIATLIAIIVHKIFRVDTMLNYYLGLNPMPARIPCL